MFWHILHNAFRHITATLIENAWTKYSFVSHKRTSWAELNLFIWARMCACELDGVCVLISFCKQMNSSCYSLCAFEPTNDRTNENCFWGTKKAHSLRFVMSHKWLRDATHSGTIPTVARWIIGNLQQAKHARNNFPLTMHFNLIQYRRNLTSAY